MTGHTALLLVHGIGAQKPGETLTKIASGFKRIDKGAAPQRTGDAIVVTIGGKTVRLYEVYWADLLMGDVTQGTFLLNEVQSLAWFPWLNFRSGNYRPGSYSMLKLAWWSLTLPFFNFLVLFSYHGAGFVAQIFETSRRKRERPPNETDLRLVKRKVLGSGSAYTVLDEILDEYVGDVFSYVNSAGKAFYREPSEPALSPALEQVYAQVMQRFQEQLLKANVDGCESIQIVAHSLGTVVTWHALSDFGVQLSDRPAGKDIRAARMKIRRLYTIGSPLEKIRFFWPRIAPLTSVSGEIKFHWDNFVSLFDPVSGMLKSFDNWGPVVNHRLIGGGFIRGHVVYEHSSVFLRVLAEGLCNGPVPFKRGFWDRVWDWLILMGETLTVPVVLFFVVFFGAGLFILIAAAIPWLLSWTVRWFLPPETWSPWVDRASAVLLLLMFIAFVVAAWRRAKEVHSRYWVENRVAPDVDKT